MQELVGLPAAAALHTLEYATAATTLASGFAYAHLYISGRLLK